MTEIETTRIELKTIKGGIKPPTYDGLLRTKAYIDERSRKEWREKYGEIHEEYVTVQTQVTVDDAGDVILVFPRYHPPGIASSSMYSGVTPPNLITKPTLPPNDQFHCNLVQAVRVEAMRRAVEIENQFERQLWWLFHNAVARGSDPERKRLGHTPASLFGCPAKTFVLAREVFKGRVKAMWDPQHFKYGLWGFENVEVDIVRGIIFVRYISGWWDRDEKLRAEKKTAAKQKDRNQPQAPQHDVPVETTHDDLDA